MHTRLIPRPDRAEGASNNIKVISQRLTPPGLMQWVHRRTVSRLIPNSLATSLRPSTIGQAVNRCLQAHFEDIRHPPLNLFVPRPHGAVLLSLKWLVLSP